MAVEDGRGLLDYCWNRKMESNRSEEVSVRESVADGVESNKITGASVGRKGQRFCDCDDRLDNRLCRWK